MTDTSAGRPRVLVPITIHFSVRYVVRTGLLARMLAFCDPVLALSWDDDDLVADLRAAGVEVVRLPDARVDGTVHDLARTLDAGFTRRLGSPSTAIDRRRRQVDQPVGVRVRRWAAWRKAQLHDLRPGAEDHARRSLPAALAAGTNIDDVEAFLRDQRIDVVFSVTPYAVQELVLLHAAARAGIRLITSILSFDNITTRPPLPVAFGRYLVWNQANARELLRGYPTVGEERVVVVGPAQFDFYSDPGRVQPEAAWRAALGLPPGVPTVLYGAGPPNVAPHEAQYVDHLLAAVDGGSLPADLHVVLRRHPADVPARWERFRRHPAVRFDDPGQVGAHEFRLGQADLSDDQISSLCSTLAHTDVHVNVSSTLTLDGAFYGKPQVGPAYDEGGRRQHRRAGDLYRREHFLEIVGSGGLELARSRSELVELVGRALIDPSRLAAPRQAMLDALCSRTDGLATQRVAAEVESFVTGVAPRA